MMRIENVIPIVIPRSILLTDSTVKLSVKVMKYIRESLDIHKLKTK